MPVTIVDLARELGMSKTTVSDALSGRGRVSEETRDRVLAAAARLGYRVNRAARSMRTQRTGAIGIYVPPRVRSIPFYMDFTFGVADQAAEMDLDLLLLSREQDGRRPRAYAVDGVVAVDPLPDDPTISVILDACVPVVTAGRAKIVTPDATADVGPGTVVFVPAGEPHRFTDVTEDLALLVVFGPAYGSRAR